MAKFVTNASGVMLLLNLIQVMESISGLVVPLAMFFRRASLSQLAKKVKLTDRHADKQLMLILRSNIRRMSSKVNLENSLSSNKFFLINVECHPLMLLRLQRDK